LINEHRLFGPTTYNLPFKQARASVLTLAYGKCFSCIFEWLIRYAQLSKKCIIRKKIFDMLLNVIILLGAQNDNNGKLSNMAVSRIQGAIRKYVEFPGSKLLIHGGYGHFNNTNRPHSYYVEQYLLNQGIKKTDIIAKLETANTVEEAAFSKNFLDAFEINSICVVTSEFHIRRAKLIFEHFFKPHLLTFVGTLNGVSSRFLQSLYSQEEKRIKEINKQGGVIFNGELYFHKG
jgi:uncharacterized SAM-binding protein YcdF (DUF218 family)